MRSAILLDLDGTLTDPKPGITRSVQYALERLGRPVPPEDDLVWMIGPPLQASFAELLGDEGLAAEGVRLYRERFSVTGLFENTPYAGIGEALAALQALDRPLFVATSKPRVFAERIAAHFDLTRFFQCVYGSELDGTRVDKRDLLAFIVAEEGLDAARSVMIGDRRHDAIGAASVGMPAIGVTWGYGSREELAGAGVGRLVHAPQELPPAVSAALIDAAPPRA